MADKKISALNGAATPLAGTEVLPIVQSGTTVKVSVANLTAGRTVTASALGVGTASPLTTLNVEGGTFLLRGGPIDIGPTSGANGAARISSSLTNGVEGKLIFSTSNSSAVVTEAMNIDKDGNATANIGNFVVGTAGKGITTGSATALGFGVNGSTTQVVINTSGYLGVGTTSPNKALVVSDNGNIGLEISPNDAAQGYTRILNYNRVAGQYAEVRYEGSLHKWYAGTGGSTLAFSIDAAGNAAVGVASRATNATDGFAYIPTCAGIPTGTPTAITGFAPMVVDATNNKLYVYVGGAWQAMN